MLRLPRGMLTALIAALVLAAGPATAEAKGDGQPAQVEAALIAPGRVMPIPRARNASERSSGGCAGPTRARAPSTGASDR